MARDAGQLTQAAISGRILSRSKDNRANQTERLKNMSSRELSQQRKQHISLISAMKYIHYESAIGI